MYTNQIDQNQNNHSGHYELSSISHRIAEVIRKRQQLATQIEPVRQHLSTLIQAIENLTQRRTELKSSLDPLEARESLEKLNLVALAESARTELARLEQLHQRFSRRTLNIGVVGRAGQGKSTFLKSLSGLSDNEIPALRGGPCTAVRSKIEHHEGETKAIVKFHSESSFLKDVIKPYYEQLRLGTPPSSLDEFATLPLPEPKPPISVTHKTMYDHLRDDYYRSIDNYRNLIKLETREISISKDEISTYVVQKRGTENRLTTFEHLAVHEVKIFCQFTKVGVSQLGLIDIPGLGDTRLGDEDLLLKTLGREVDIVLFLRRPDAMRDSWLASDIHLYDLAAKALPDLSDRAFMVLNQTEEGNNLDACRALQKQPSEMKFVSREIANCASLDDANNILDVILRYLDLHIQQLEEHYAQSCQNSLIALHQAIKSDLSKARHALRSSAQENRLFQRLFDELMQNVANELRALVRTLAEEQATIDTEFEVVVNAALDACENDSGIPSETQILNRVQSIEGKDVYSAAYGLLIPELRAHLSKNFLALDEGLQQAANRLKLRVAQVLIESGLGGLTDASGIEFLEAVTEMLSERGNSLELGFRTLTTFNISYGALILRLIRQNLMSVLDPDGVIKNGELREAAAETFKVLTEAGVAIGATATTSVSPELVGQVIQATDQLAKAVQERIFDFDAETVHGNLQHLHQKAIRKCRETLERWLEAPSQIRYYMATEFVDRVLDAENMKAEWDEFLRDTEIRSKVWNEFGRIEAMKVTHQNWLDAVQKVLALNQRNKFEFLD